ncbi:MAG: hypothetical protein M1834_003269 [Cirrosporium novae-zelandiae]|nr:MAG: hypothetical protein M1834_003269 [Cirrosporium novae-zelandiae]
MVNSLTSGCHAWVDGVNNQYGYKPSLGAGAAFCVLFGLSMIGHIVEAVRRKRWWLLVFAIGALAPTFFTAGIYVILGRLIYVFGQDTSPLSPKLYLYIFCTIDTISLVVQAVGGGSASVALNNDGDTAIGTHTMVAGIVFQLASVLVFTWLFFLVVFRAFKLKVPALKERKVQLLLGATIWAIVMIVIRSIYRTIELLQGWRGYLIEHEGYFIALDGTMMASCVIVFNIFNPAELIPRMDSAPLVEGEQARPKKPIFRLRRNAEKERDSEEV